MVANPADWTANHEVQTQEHKQTSGKAKAVKQKQKQSYKSAITPTGQGLGKTLPGAAR
jgi:hypothetical protein